LPAPKGQGAAKVTLHHFAGGMGGTVDDNVKRWCGQFADADGKPLDRRR